MSESIIKIESLSKTFISKDRKGFFRSKKREIQALKNINLVINEGEVFGLLGPNGAGKTTLIKCITTLILPTSGGCWVNGYSLEKEENMVRASMGCMLMGERGLYWKLTGRENLRYFSSLYHVPKKKAEERINYLIDLLKLEEFIDRTVETYSSGQKMILAFAKSLVNDAPILVLDEPTVTMDVHTARELKAIVKQLNKDGHTIVYTTHVMQEADELCDRIAIIDKGEIIALGTPQELKASIVQEDVVNIEGVIPKSVVESIRGIEGVKSAVVKGQKDGHIELGVMCKNSRLLLPKIIQVLTEGGAEIEYINPQDVTLEDVFIAKTGRSLSVDTREVVKDEKESGSKGRA